MNKQEINCVYFYSYTKSSLACTQMLDQQMSVYTLLSFNLTYMLCQGAFNKKYDIVYGTYEKFNGF